MTPTGKSDSIFGGGVPTEPDVMTLLNTFGCPQDSTPLTYIEVAEAIGISHPAGKVMTLSRFKTVTQAWRKQLYDLHRVILVAREGAFRARTPGERVAYGKGKTKSAIRAADAAWTVVSDTDRARLTEREQSDADKIQRVTSSLRMAALAEKRKRDAPPLPPVTAKA